MYRYRLWSLFITLALLLVVADTGHVGAAVRARSAHRPSPRDVRAVPAKGARYQTVITNPLVNPGFEAGWAYTPADKYDAGGQYVSSEPYGEIFVPTGWTVFFKEGKPVEHDPSNTVGWAKPEIKLIQRQDPFLDPPRIYAGQKATQVFTFWKIHDAGFYQQVNVGHGTFWELSAYTHAWTSPQDNPYVSPDPDNMTQLVGIDPTGGTNPYAPSVVWSQPDHIVDVYTQTHTVKAVALNSTITVFLRSWAKWPYKHNDAYWDEVNLKNVGVVYYLPLAFRQMDGEEPPAPPPIQTTEDSPFGVVFVNPAEPGTLADEGRYQKAADLGVKRDRWPLYWYHVESQTAVYNWAAYDTVVEADLNHGLQSNPVLMGTPGFYSSGGLNIAPPQLGSRPSTTDRAAGQTATQMTPPTGLYNSVFADGTDLPGAGKTINPSNPWANLVYRAVARYRPGGLLGQEKGWPADKGIRVWEIWNEPDLPLFWGGSVTDYARLLKVAALAARHADPDAVIMMGGLANPPAPGYFADVMTQLNQDPAPGLRDSQNWYFDAVALHNYDWSWYTGDKIRQVRATLNYYRGLYPALSDKAIWVNETGVAVYDDYPGPTWQKNTEADNMATMEEQAAFVIQNAVYALAEGAATVFHFQLYDGCGNDPPGTDFPPDSLYLCQQGLPCASASAYGLWRNKPTDSCYRQHPQPDTARPAHAAYRVAVQTLSGAQPLWHETPNGNHEVFAFYRPDTQQRIIATWARYHFNTTATISAVASQATLIDQSGAAQTIYPANGAYTLELPAATNLNQPYPPDGSASIGGRPYILIEAWNNVADH